MQSIPMATAAVTVEDAAVDADCYCSRLPGGYHDVRARQAASALWAAHNNCGLFADSAHRLQSTALSHSRHWPQHIAEAIQKDGA
jgi:hypothetical protein